jgi:hypothetical protein
VFSTVGASGGDGVDLSDMGFQCGVEDRTEIAVADPCEIGEAEGPAPIGQRMLVEVGYGGVHHDRSCLLRPPPGEGTDVRGLRANRNRLDDAGYQY